MRSLWAAAFLLRRLRGETGVALLVFLLVAATSFLFAAGPRLFERAADEGLRHDLGAATSLQRNIQLSANTQVPPGGLPLARLLEVGDRLEEELPASIRAVLGGRGLMVTSPRFAVADAPIYNSTFVSLRHQDGLTDAIALVDGRMPRATGLPLPTAVFGFLPEELEPVDTMPVVEIALSEQTAATIGVEVGDRLQVSADSNDGLMPRPLAAPLEAEFRVVGLFSVTDAVSDIWFDDRSLQQVTFGGSEDNPLAFAVGLVGPDALGDLDSSGLPFRIDWRFLVAPQRVDSGELDALTHDLDRLATTFVSSSAAARQGVPVLRTGLPDLLRRYLAERSASQAVLSVAAIGPIVLAAGAVGMVGVLLVSRRRPALALARGRGATGLLLIGAQLWEALLLAGGASLLGLLLATVLVSGPDTAASLVLSLLVAAATVGALLVATWPVAWRPLRELAGAEEQAVVRPSPRRLVLEGTAVLLALGGVFLLRQRGLAIGGTDEVRFDPFLAATPVLAGLAVGIVAMRLYPLPIRGLGWLAAARRDLIPVLGLRTVGRHPSAANLPLLVLMLTAAFASFSSVVTTTVARGQLTASWQNLGADYRIERVAGGPITDAVDPTAVEGVQAVSAGLLEPTAGFRGAPELAPRGSIAVYALQPAAYDQVVAGSPIDPAWPVELLAEPGEPGRVGTPSNPIPVIMSRRLPTGSEPIVPGDLFSVIIGGQEINVVDVQERDAFPGLDHPGPFVIAPFDHLRAAYAGTTLQPTLLMVRGPGSVGDRLAETVRGQLSAARVESRHAAYAALQEAPLVASVIVGFRVALLAAAAYTALAILAALTLSAARRSRDLAFLRTLGVSARQALGLTVMEHGPPVLIAVIPGILLGIGVAYLLGPALGLSAFAGTDAALALSVDWGAVAVLSGLLVGVVALAIGVSTWISRRTRATDALRFGED